MTLRRRLSISIAVLLLTVSVAGCASQTEATDPGFWVNTYWQFGAMDRDPDSGVLIKLEAGRDQAFSRSGTVSLYGHDGSVGTWSANADDRVWLTLHGDLSAAGLPSGSLTGTRDGASLYSPLILVGEDAQTVELEMVEYDKYRDPLLLQPPVTRPQSIGHTDTCNASSGDMSHAFEGSIWSGTSLNDKSRFLEISFEDEHRATVTMVNRAEVLERREYETTYAGGSARAPGKLCLSISTPTQPLVVPEFVTTADDQFPIINPYIDYPMIIVDSASGETYALRCVRS